jgi:hypothetical protein
MVGDLLPVDNEHWAILILLRQIMDICFAPVLSSSATFTLDGLVYDHHHLLVKVSYVTDVNLPLNCIFISQ